MSAVDWIVLAGTISFIVARGAWKTRDVRDMKGYFHGGNTLAWPTIGLSIMATQASAITFVSTPVGPWRRSEDSENVSSPARQGGVFRIFSTFRDPPLPPRR